MDKKSERELFLMLGNIKANVEHVPNILRKLDKVEEKCTQADERSKHNSTLIYWIMGIIAGGVIAGGGVAYYLI